ncbi:hypothetical protein NKG05_20685 [Oerskovia sp. M15]
MTHLMDAEHTCPALPGSAPIHDGRPSAQGRRSEHAASDRGPPRSPARYVRGWTRRRAARPRLAGMGWYENMGKWWERHRFGVDVITTIVVGLVFVPTAIALNNSGSSGDTFLVGLVTAAMLAPLPWRRVRPTASAIAVYSIALLHLALGLVLVFPTDFVLLVSLFSVTVYGPAGAPLRDDLLARRFARPRAVAGHAGQRHHRGRRPLRPQRDVQRHELPRGLGVRPRTTLAPRDHQRARGPGRAARGRARPAGPDRHGRGEARIAREMHDIVAHSSP